MRESGDWLADRVARSLDRVGLLGNGIGGLIVGGFLLFLFPTTVSDEDFDRLMGISIPVFAVLMPVFLVLGRAWSIRRSQPVIDWLRSGRPAGEDERRAVLRFPLEFAGIAAVFWALGALVFSAIWLDAGWVAADALGTTVVLGGLSAGALQYLLVERTLRPVAGRALAGGPPPDLPVPGVATRMTMAWLLATGVPVLGIAGFAIADLSGADLDRDQLILASLFLATRLSQSA